ncbi:hypothetical protein FGB62_188g05 [Gracilaria domingensis]|nr:hypothetical protein FGB62_188g05 [Gracilaria domingensis]
MVANDARGRQRRGDNGGVRKRARSANGAEGAKAERRRGRRLVNTAGEISLQGFDRRRRQRVNNCACIGAQQLQSVRVMPCCVMLQRTRPPAATGRSRHIVTDIVGSLKSTHCSSSPLDEAEDAL